MTPGAQGTFNTRRFERLLLDETDPARRVLISQLLGEERARIQTRATSGDGVASTARLRAA